MNERRAFILAWSLFALFMVYVPNIIDGIMTAVI